MNQVHSILFLLHCTYIILFFLFQYHYFINVKSVSSSAWWYTPVLLVLGRLREKNCLEFEKWSEGGSGGGGAGRRAGRVTEHHRTQTIWRHPCPFFSLVFHISQSSRASGDTRPLEGLSCSRYYWLDPPGLFSLTFIFWSNTWMF